MRKENKWIFFLGSVFEEPSQLLKQKRKQKRKKETPKSQKKDMRSQGIAPPQDSKDQTSEANKAICTNKICNATYR